MIINTFKQALREGRPQIGLWVGLADAYAVEMLGGAGFDWLLLDAEHAPNDLRSVLGQLQALAPYPVHPIVRPAESNTALIKQLLELGPQTLLVPMVDTPEQAARTVAATRYPPQGVRGVGSALARSSRWNQIEDYLHLANDQICVLVQAETVAAIQNLAAIAAVDGVDGVFFGPADLSASMGLLGQPNHPDVLAAIFDGITTVRAAGKAPGVLTSDRALARRFIEHGALFAGVGIDTVLLVSAAKALAAAFKGTPAAGAGTGYA